MGRRRSNRNFAVCEDMHRKSRWKPKDSEHRSNMHKRFVILQIVVGCKIDLYNCVGQFQLSLSWWPAPSAWVPPNLSWGDSRLYAVLQRTLEEDCRQAEEPKRLVDEASRFHLWRQHQHSAVICSGTLLFSSRVLRPSLVTLCSHKSGRCAVELYHAPHLWYPPFYTSPITSSAL